MSNNHTSDYWDTIVERPGGRDHEDLWRAHLQGIYEELIDRWMAGSQDGLTLKTDLYDEAISRYNVLPLCANKSKGVIGTDVSFEVAAAAKKRMLKTWDGWCNAVCTDVRRLPFKPESFDAVISNSTLDHFPKKESILASLRDIHRLLKPGGSLFITLDNPSNPVVFLRNAMPYRLLKLSKLIPFYMGVTLSKTQLIRVLESCGFRVHESRAIVHSPRILAIWTGHILSRAENRKVEQYARRVLRICERLEKLPTRYLTGYYVAAIATKR
ncbi:MAG: class I SAM-dependent methyltransferase [Deltaproteobacteria bacterium]|nr:class I SAM-dependent methyltransferase [Deltaproteobacteria bacterium]